MNDPLESDYVRRPDAQGHLRVMELLRKWDPIGVLDDPDWPKDEYDGYSVAIVHMLDAGASDKELYMHMRGLVTGNMGISCNEKKTREIASELTGFWKRWKTEPEN